MLVRKQKTKTKFRKASLSRKSRRLARKAKNRALHTRLLFLRVRRVVTDTSMKCSKKLLSRYAGYRRARRALIERRIARQTRSVVNQQAAVVRIASTNRPTRPLYTGRTRVLGAARHRLRLRLRQYRRRNTRLARARLRQYRRVLRRHRSLRRWQVSITCYRRGSLRVVRTILPFLPVSARCTARIRSTKVYYRTAIRALRCSKSRAPGVVILRRKLIPQRKYKRKSIRRPRRKVSPTIWKKSSPGKGVGSKLRVASMTRPLSNSGKGRRWSKLKLRFFLKRAKAPTKLKLWLSLKRANKRIAIRRRHCTWKWRLRLKKSASKLKLHPKKSTSKLSFHRRFRRSERAHKARLITKVAKHRQKRYRPRVGRRRLKVLRLRKKRRVRVFARRVRRFLVRCRRSRVSRSALVRTRKRHTRRFFLRRVARRCSWLRLVARRIRRTKAPLYRAIRRRTPRSSVSNQQLLFLRAAIRTRTRNYRAARRVLRLRSRQKIKFYRRLRHLGRRRRLSFRWGKGHYLDLREKRFVRRESRRMNAMLRSRGRSWARWRRLPRRFSSRYARVVRQLFSVTPKLFRRGAWSHFYRDRQFKPYASKKRIYTSAELGTAAYQLPRRSLVLRSRHTQRPQWYIFRTASGRIRTALLKKHKSLGCLINRRLRARRQLVCGTTYGFQESIGPVFSAKANLQTSLRRLCGQKVRGRRRRYKNLDAQTLPRVIHRHPATSRRVTPSAALVGGRLHNALLRKSTRPLRDASYPSKAKARRNRFTYELQQELSLVAACLPTQTPVIGKRAVQHIALKRVMHVHNKRFARKVYRAVEWFKRLHYHFDTLKRQLRRAQRSRRRRKPRAWRGRLKALDFELTLDPRLDTALTFLDKDYAKIQPKTETKVRTKTKTATAVKTRTRPKRV